MKFYLCQTADGPRYARTQADAKALDKNFETVNYDVDQGSLVDRFNALLLQGQSLVHADDTAVITGLTATALTPEMADAIADAEPEGAPRKAKGTERAPSLTNWSQPPPEGSCERCTAMSASARSIEGIMAITNIEHAIDHFDEPKLKRVASAVTTRRAELKEAS